MNRSYFLYCFLILVFNLSAEEYETPQWARDRDLISEKEFFTSSEHHKIASPFIVGSDTIIFFHQQVISPADGPRSHYIPSSSSYALQAIYKYGFINGFLMGCDRLLRENSESWIYPHITTRDNDVLKLDPVP